MAIYKSGFTRIPVFSEYRQNIVGVLFAKDLILVDPDDCIQVATVLSFRSAILSTLFLECILFIEGSIQFS